MTRSVALRAGCAVWVLGLCALPAVHADETPPYYSAVKLPARPLPWTPKVAVDFGGLLRKFGEKAPLDPASIRVLTADGKALPTRFAPAEGEKDVGHVLWNAPATPKAAAPVEYRIHFAPEGAKPWTPVRPEEVPEGNLAPNGGFENVSGKRPAHWLYARTAEIVRDPKAVRSGGICLRLLPKQGRTGKRWQNSVRGPGVPGVIVEPGKNYTFRYWARSEKATPGSYRLIGSSQVYWYRANKSYLKHQNFGTMRKPEEKWRARSTTLQAPPEARYATLIVSFYAKNGALYLDDFAITPSQAPRVESARRVSDGKEVALGVASPDVRRFDFGKDATAPWPNFVSVTRDTDYTKERGHGWLRRYRPQGFVRPLPDNLARDFVRSHGLTQFAVDLPDGEYAAWLLIGDTGLGSSVMATNVDWQVRIGGREALRYKPAAKEWFQDYVFRGFDAWWKPGDDVYDRFIASHFVEREVPFTVRRGRVVFAFRGVPLCAMALYPTKLKAQMKEELDGLRAARKRAADVRYEPPEPEKGPAPDVAAKRRGYAVFSRDLSKPVAPPSVAQDGETVAELATFAAPGEHEALTFSVQPLRDLGDVSVAVGDFVAETGARFPAEQVDVGVVRYVPWSLSKREYRYTVKPGPVQPRNPMPVGKGMTTRWLVRLRVPEAAAPGVYRSAVRIAPTKAPAFSLPVRLRVVPIRLGPTPVVAGLYHFDRTYWYTLFWRRCFEDKDGWLRRETFQHEYDDFKHLQEYGLNSVAFCDELRSDAKVTPDGKLTIKKNCRFVQWMDTYKRAGMGPMPWYGFSALSTGYLARGLYGAKLKQFSPEWQRAYFSIISWAKDQERKRGWPEVIAYLSDELSNHGAKGAAKGRKLVELTRDLPGVRTTSSMNGPWEQVMLPGLKIAMPNHAFPITTKSLKKIRDAKCELWFYNIGNDRVVWGIYLWKTGAKGRFQWFHRYAVTRPWDTFDGDARYCVTWVTPGKPLPTVTLHAIREGLDDLRYLTRLEQAMAEARRSGNANAVQAAAAARRDLDELRAAVPDDARLIIGVIDAKEAGRPAVGQLSLNRYLDRWRWVVAGHILKIQNALGQGAGRP